MVYGVKVSPGQAAIVWDVEEALRDGRLPSIHSFFLAAQIKRDCRRVKEWNRG